MIEPDLAHDVLNTSWRGPVKVLQGFWQYLLYGANGIPKSLRQQGGVLLEDW